MTCRRHGYAFRVTGQIAGGRIAFGQFSLAIGAGVVLPGGGPLLVGLPLAFDDVGQRVTYVVAVGVEPRIARDGRGPALLLGAAQRRFPGVQ